MLRKSYVIIVFLTCISPIVIFAQKYHIYQQEIDNGLDVIVIENSTVPLVTIEIDVRNGSYTEPPEYDGLSHLYEHMFFKANESIPDQERYLERTRELGMVWNGTTSEERVNYFFTISKDSLDQGFAFMKAAIMTPLFLQEELERERPVVAAEFDRAESNPYFILDRAVSQKLWYRYFSRKNVIGDRQIILTAGQEKMRTIQKRYYIPNNSALLVAGDVEHEAIFQLAEATFGDWERGGDPSVLYPVPEHPSLGQSDTVIVEQPVNVVTLQMGLHGPSISKDRNATYAADVLIFILRQKNSHFQKQLVESGLSVYADLGYYTLDHTGPITIFLQTTADKFEEAIKVLFSGIDQLTDPDYITDEQIEYAKTQLEIGEMYAQESPSQFVSTLGFWWAVSGSLDYYLNYVDNLKKVTREDLNNYVRKYIQNQPYVMGILLSPDDGKTLSF
ncbi:insulinase family protein [bacterium]|nr:insulinase family protein [bacterium]RQV97808.1 MAG: insulinase family protein [bacterium]